MYTEHVISFIDILGYSDLVTEKDYDYIKQCCGIFLKVFGANSYDEKIRRRTTYFSDTIVTSIPVHLNPQTTRSHGILYHELSALALAQADLFSSRGILVRGSITIGQLYHENNEIFGPALIRAHKIEQTACYPRIVIDRELFRRYFTSRDLVNYQHLTHSIDYKYIRPIIRREANGDRIVDYLLYVINNFDYPEEIPDFLLKHKDFIKVGLANKSESIRKKFLWLSNYHNQSIERISDLTERNSFRI